MIKITAKMLAEHYGKNEQTIKNWTSKGYSFRRLEDVIKIILYYENKK